MGIRISLISICFFFILELHLSHGQDDCPLNEVPVDCVDACNTCESTGRVCSLICTPGCDCTPGYTRNRFGVCIPQRHCNEDSLSPPDGDVIRYCPDPVRCSNACRRRGFVGGMCIGFTGRTCRCSNRRHLDVRDVPPYPPNVEVSPSGTQLNDGDNGGWGISGRRRSCRRRRTQPFGCRG